MMDNIDKKILNILQEKFRISYKDLGKEMGMAASSVHNRVQKMIDTGIIRKENTLIDPFKVGFETIAIIGLTVDPLKMKEVAEKIASYDNVQLVATSTGDHDLVVRVVEKNDKSLWRFINKKIKTIEGIRTQMDVSSLIDIFKMNHRINLKVK
ncbi:MAG: Lrp/AsnC family transcriptional regulator [Promethearchaeota archaeon]|nr:MAG: Lrp/AsnC family transcriptional regulator [Candidatus Lokiarchaeota archaeon]